MDTSGTKYSGVVQVNGINIEFKPYTAYSSPGAIPELVYI